MAPAVVMLMQGRLTPIIKFALFAFTGTMLISHGRESHACSPPAWWAQIHVVGPIPKDSAIPIDLGRTVESGFEYEVSDASGSPVPVVLENSAEESTKFLRPAAGEFPLGELRIVLVSNYPSGGQKMSNPYDFVVTNERVADWKVRLRNPKVEAIRVPDESSPKILCHRTPVRGCGEVNFDPATTKEIASRAKKVAYLSFETEMAGWARYTMLQTFKYTVRRSDGALVEEPSTGYGHVFESTGVEYCAEATFTPRYGTAPARTERVCVPNGDLRYDVSQADHDKMLVESSQEQQCSSLDFPKGVPVPGAVADKSTGGEADGCSIAPPDRRGKNAVAWLLLGAACVLWRKRRLTRGRAGCGA